MNWDHIKASRISHLASHSCSLEIPAQLPLDHSSRGSMQIGSAAIGMPIKRITATSSVQELGTGVRIRVERPRRDERSGSRCVSIGNATTPTQ